MLIPKRKCLVGDGRIGCGESGTPSFINLYTMKQSAWRTWMSCSYDSTVQWLFYSCGKILWNDSYLACWLINVNHKTSMSNEGYRDHSANGLSQWETTLHYNVACHCLSSYTELSMSITYVNVVFTQATLALASIAPSSVWCKSIIPKV